MKSYRLRSFRTPLEPEERPTPVPKKAEVLLRVAAAGVCHSDLHIWEGGYDLGHGKRLQVQDRGVCLPLTLGHETVGFAVATGPEAVNVTEGRAYLVYPWIGCGQCTTCRDGNENLCANPRSLGVYRDGGYADHLLVPDSRYLLDIHELNPVTAAPLACSGLTAYSALRKAGATVERDPIVIFGAGGLGLMGLALLRTIGGVGAIVVDVDPRKLDAAKRAGALATIDGRAPDALEQITRACSGSPRVAIDFVGSAESASTAFQAIGKNGRLIMVGLFGGAAPWPLPFIALKAITIQGSYVGNLVQLHELLDLVRMKSVVTIPITRVALDRVNETLRDLQNGNVLGRAVMTP
jgi:alcohol dehydrogenase, propanol-preferring